MTSFKSLIKDVHACTICQENLPYGARPVLQIHPDAKILIAGQAPGRKVHESGIPFNDPSGDRLRSWMGISTDTFYNDKKIAILPMGFCFPGSSKSGDLPPRPECLTAWRQKLLNQLNHIELTLVLGKYAQDYHFPNHKASLTELVKSWQNHWPKKLPLPHPSPRNNLWLKRNPWFETEILPPLKQHINQLIT